MLFVCFKAALPNKGPKGVKGVNNCAEIQLLPAYYPKDGKPISYGGKTYED